MPLSAGPLASRCRPRGRRGRGPRAGVRWPVARGAGREPGRWLRSRPATPGWPPGPHPAARAGQPSACSVSAASAGRRRRSGPAARWTAPSIPTGSPMPLERPTTPHLIQVVGLRQSPEPQDRGRSPTPVVRCFWRVRTRWPPRGSRRSPGPRSCRGRPDTLRIQRCPPPERHEVRLAALPEPIPVLVPAVRLRRPRRGLPPRRHPLPGHRHPSHLAVLDQEVDPPNAVETEYEFSCIGSGVYVQLCMWRAR